MHINAIGAEVSILKRKLRFQKHLNQLMNYMKNKTKLLTSKYQSKELDFFQDLYNNTSLDGYGVKRFGPR